MEDPSRDGEFCVSEFSARTRCVFSVPTLHPVHQQATPHCERRSHGGPWGREMGCGRIFGSCRRRGAKTGVLALVRIAGAVASARTASMGAERRPPSGST